MKIQPTAHPIPFPHLITLFEGTGNTLRLKPTAGEGYVQTFDIEKGLQARLWNCVFREGLEMFCDKENSEISYFTLAYFLNREALRFTDNNDLFHNSIIWDTLFISSNSLLRMYVPPETAVVCLNISFSKTWLEQHLCNSSKTHQQLHPKVFMAPSCAFLEYMNGEEKNLLLNVMDTASKNELNTLQLKSAVLKTIADFFNKLKHKTTLCAPQHNMHDLLMETERYLKSNVKGAIPSCKTLACKYGFSEVSLKRHFKQRYGVNMSTYFMHKKMEFALQVMRENNLSEESAARQLGYKNKRHFSTMLQKYTSTIQLPDTSEVLNNEVSFDQVV